MHLSLQNTYKRSLKSRLPVLDYSDTPISTSDGIMISFDTDQLDEGTSSTNQDYYNRDTKDLYNLESYITHEVNML